MKRLILAAVCAIVMGQPVLAQSIDERIASSLQAEGYQIVTMSRTWLGRIYVIAETETVRREMVFSPATGEVLRDYAVTKGPARIADQGDGNDSGNSTAVASGVTAPPGAVVTATRSEDAGINDSATITLDTDAPSVVVVDPVIVPPAE
jgi:hypothetical protein